jgi:hypothetical protein
MRRWVFLGTGVLLFWTLIWLVVSRSNVLPKKELYSTYPVHSLGGIKTGDFPEQDRIWFPKKFEFKPYYTIKPLATFRLAGYVLSACDYSKARSAEAQHSPVDFAMAWGEAASPGSYNLMQVSQSNRFYNWTLPGGGLSHSYVATQSANMHMVPNDSEIEEALMKVKAGDEVRFSGYLVEIRAEDGWHWKSSLTRGDEGAGACELVLVTEFDHKKNTKKRKAKR